MFSSTEVKATFISSHLFLSEGESTSKIGPRTRGEKKEAAGIKRNVDVSSEERQGLIKRSPRAKETQTHTHSRSTRALHPCYWLMCHPNAKHAVTASTSPYTLTKKLPNPVQRLANKAAHRREGKNEERTGSHMIYADRQD